jgi:hypothetical protein
MSMMYLVLGASGEFSDWADWPVCVCATEADAEAIKCRASEEMSAALVLGKSCAPWEEVEALLVVDPKADVDDSTYYRIKPVRYAAASGIEARSDATPQSGAAEGESPSDAQSDAAINAATGGQQ